MITPPFIWKNLRYLKRENHNWGDPDLIYPFLIAEIDKFIEKIQAEIYVTSGTNGVHTESSLHYPRNNSDGLGHAVDLVFTKLEREKLPDLFFEAMRFEFTGIGLLSNAVYGGKSVSGLHLEMGDYTLRRFWIQVKAADGKKIYEPVNFKNLNAYC